VEINMLTRNDQKIVHALKPRLEEVAGDRLQAVIVYGSRVWGQAEPESDLDVAAIVREFTPELEASLLEAAYQVMWDHDFSPLLSLRVFDADSFAAYQEKGFSFYRKVAQEGISL
jgi:predicted nucleotidyltransferase